MTVLVFSNVWNVTGNKNGLCLGRVKTSKISNDWCITIRGGAWPGPAGGSILRKVSNITCEDGESAPARPASTCWWWKHGPFLRQSTWLQHVKLLVQCQASHLPDSVMLLVMDCLGCTWSRLELYNERATYVPGTWTFSSIIWMYFFALCGSFS